MVEISERIRSQLGIGASAAEGTKSDEASAGDVMSPADDLPITLDD